MSMDKKTIAIKCPACGEQVQSVAYDGIIKGYCANEKKQVIIKVD
jgi:endogenous inhibitor of DNA gyrase (YacG/DUF329 family)